jgi:hypothetical protein
MEHLPTGPIRDYGLERLIEESKRSLVDSGVIPEAGLDWVPDVLKYVAVI